jgi:hypothetical protein
MFILSIDLRFLYIDQNSGVATYPAKIEVVVQALTKLKLFGLSYGAGAIEAW